MVDVGGSATLSGMIFGEGYTPKLRKIEAGDFVYVRQPGHTPPLTPEVKQLIYRIKEVRPAGVLLLQGKCGGEVTTNMINVAPCHLPNIDPTIDHTLAIPNAGHACQICNFPDQESVMLLCDGCGDGYHMHCLDPPLTQAPAAEEPWWCPNCTKPHGTTRTQVTTQARAGEGDQEGHGEAFRRQGPVASDDAEAHAVMPMRQGRAARAGREASTQPAPTMLTRSRRAPAVDDAVARSDAVAPGEVSARAGREDSRSTPLTTGKRDARAEELHGRAVYMEAAEYGDAPRHGVVRFRGIQDRPYYFDVVFSDGDVHERISLTTLKRRYRALDGQELVAGAVLGWSDDEQEKEHTLPPLPLRRELANNAPAVLSALVNLMPGEWPETYPSRVSKFVPGGEHELKALSRSWPDSCATQAEVESLLKVLDLRGVFGVLDPWAHSTVVQDTLERRGLPVVTNWGGAGDVPTSHRYDALQLEGWDSLRRQGVCLDVVISSPWFMLLDLALPMAVLCVETAVCMRVPWNYLNEAPQARKCWLRRLHKEGRTVWLKGLPPTANSRSHVWLLVFKDDVVRRRMLTKEVNSYADEAVVWQL